MKKYIFENNLLLKSLLLSEDLLIFASCKASGRLAKGEWVDVLPIYGRLAFGPNIPLLFY